MLPTGVSDPNSTAASIGIVDPALFIDSEGAIKAAIEQLNDPSLTQQQVGANGIKGIDDHLWVSCYTVCRLFQGLGIAKGL